MDSNPNSEKTEDNERNYRNILNENKREEYIRKYGMEGCPAKNMAPWLRRESENKHSRRLYSHDYCSPGFYHITATLNEHTHMLSYLPNPPLSELKKNEQIYPILMPLGEKVNEELIGIPSFHPQLKILQYIIMPDHIHFVLQVKERLKRKLGYELAGFFGACSRHYNEFGALPEH